MAFARSGFYGGLSLDANNYHSSNDGEYQVTQAVYGTNAVDPWNPGSASGETSQAITGWTNTDWVSTGGGILGNLSTLGFALRLGWENTWFETKPVGAYFAVEGNGTFGHIFASNNVIPDNSEIIGGTYVFDISGQHSHNAEAVSNLLGGGLFLKGGISVNDHKTKLYALVGAQYVNTLDGIKYTNYVGTTQGTLDDGTEALYENALTEVVGDLSMVYVGGGLGVKQAINSLVDIFLEFKVMPGIHSHYNRLGRVGTFTSDGHGISNALANGSGDWDVQGGKLVPALNGENTGSFALTGQSETGYNGAMLYAANAGIDLKF